MFLVWKMWGKPDPSMTANGMLAGLVAITAPCAFVGPIGAVIIGIVAGFIVVGAIVFVERKLKVDDPVGAVSVHGVNGLWGLLAVGLFADGSYGDGCNGVEGTVTRPVLRRRLGPARRAGDLRGGRRLSGPSALMYAFFRIQKKVQGIRVTRDEEMIGLDIPEMGVPAYPSVAPPVKRRTRHEIHHRDHPARPPRRRGRGPDRSGASTS